jgi:hypothetical protein
MESADVATSGQQVRRCFNQVIEIGIVELFRGAQCLIEVIRSSGEEM